MSQLQKFKILHEIFRSDTGTEPDFYMLCHDDYDELLNELDRTLDFNIWFDLSNRLRGRSIKVNGVQLSVTDDVGNGEQCFVMKNPGSKAEFTRSEKTYKTKG